MAEQPHGSMASLDAARCDCVLFTRILQALVQGRVRILPHPFYPHFARGSSSMRHRGSPWCMDQCPDCAGCLDLDRSDRLVMKKPPLGEKRLVMWTVPVVLNRSGGI